MAYFGQEYRIRGKFFSENRRTLRQVHFSLYCSIQLELSWSQIQNPKPTALRVLELQVYVITLSYM